MNFAENGFDLGQEVVRRHPAELLEDYVTDRALDGLFLRIAKEEERIRTDPLARTTELLRKYFGDSE